MGSGDAATRGSGVGSALTGQTSGPSTRTLWERLRKFANSTTLDVRPAVQRQSHDGYLGHKIAKLLVHRRDRSSQADVLDDVRDWVGEPRDHGPVARK